MSNRNPPNPSKAQSKSPQPQIRIQINKDMVKQLLLQKIQQQTQAQVVEKKVQTQPDLRMEDDDEGEDVLDFKQEIEKRFERCKNRNYQFPYESDYEDEESDEYIDLIDVTLYNLHSQNGIVPKDYAYEEDDEESNKLTDATIPEFVRQVNIKLEEYLRQTRNLDLSDEIESDKKLLDPTIKIKTEGNKDDIDYLDTYITEKIKAPTGARQHNYLKAPVSQQRNFDGFKQKQLAEMNNFNHSDTSLLFDKRLIQSLVKEQQSREHQKSQLGVIRNITPYGRVNLQLRTENNNKYRNGEVSSGSKQGSQVKVRSGYEGQGGQQIDPKSLIMQQLLRITGQKGLKPLAQQNTMSASRNQNLDTSFTKQAQITSVSHQGHHNNRNLTQLNSQQIQKKPQERPNSNNNYINLSSNISSSIIINQSTRPKGQDSQHSRVKTEPFYLEEDDNITQFKASHRQKQQNKQQQRGKSGYQKKVYLDKNSQHFGNLTMDQKLLEQIEKNFGRSSLTQNRGAK